MVFSLDAQEKIIATLEEEGKKADHTCRIVACDNPACKCNIVQITISSLTGEEFGPDSHVIPYHVVKQTIAFSDKEEIPKNHWDYANKFLAQLDQEDFQFLREHHYHIKNIQTELQDINTIQVSFNYLEISQKKIMCAYNEALPFGDYLLVGLEGKSFNIIDQYCLQANCECRDVYLNYYEYDNEAKGKNLVYTIFLNYLTHHWQETDDSPQPVDMERIRQDTETQLPDLYERLAKRHVRLKAIYRHCRQVHFKDVDSLPDKERKNAPCPCGSGHKYKSCCMQ